MKTKTKSKSPMLDKAMAGMKRDGLLPAAKTPGSGPAPCRAGRGLGERRGEVKNHLKQVEDQHKGLKNAESASVSYKTLC